MIKKFNYVFENIWFQLTILCSVGLIIRIIFVPLNLPITQDGTGYFWYAIDTNILGNFPNNDCEWKCTFPNTGWASFLSLFFMMLSSENYLDYMNLQRYLTVFLSVITTIPMYFLSRIFLKKEMAIIAASILLFNPRIIENSVLGITEPLYILTFVTMLYLFLKYMKNLPFIAFSLIGIMSMIRYEGFLTIIPITIIYFYKVRFSKKSLSLFFISIMIFLFIILTWGQMKTELYGNDGILNQVSAGPKFYSDSVNLSKDKNEVLVNFISTGVNYLIRFFGISTFPLLLIITPIGFILLFIKKDFDKLKIFLPLMLTLFVPAFYAYSRGYLEVRYLLILFPLFSILGTRFFEKILQNKKPKWNYMVIIIIIFSGISFIILNNINEIDPREGYNFSRVVASEMKVVNTYSQAKYLDNIILESAEQFPFLRKDMPKGVPVLYLHRCAPTIIFEGCDEGYHDLKEFIQRNRNYGLTHIVTDNGFLYNPFFNDDFENLEKYPYLIKIYDTSDEGFKTYYGKIFLIDFEKFEKIVNSK